MRFDCNVHHLPTRPHWGDRKAHYCVSLIPMQVLSSFPSFVVCLGTRHLIHVSSNALNSMRKRSRMLFTQQNRSLVPRPRPAFRRLQYSTVKRGYCKRRKAGRGLGTRLAKSYVLNQTWLGSDTDLFTFRYRCAVIRCNTTFWQLSDSKCNRMCNSSVD